MSHRQYRIARYDKQATRSEDRSSQLLGSTLTTAARLSVRPIRLTQTYSPFSSGDIPEHWPAGTLGRNITTMGARFRLGPLAVLVFALLITANAIGQSQGNRSFFKAPVASFARLPAVWHEYREMPGATALSWHYRPSQFGWAASMPRGGIAVTVYFPHVLGRQRYRPLRLVLSRRPSTLLEGTHDTKEYRIFGRVRGVDVNIFIDIRGLRPSRRQLRTAQRVVSSVRFS